MRALPYPDADRMVVTAGDQAPAFFLDWQREAKSFSAMCALRDATFDVTGSDQPERIIGAIVTAGFFDVIRSGRRSAGRWLRRRLQRRTRRGHLRRYWNRRYGGDPTSLATR